MEKKLKGIVLFKKDYKDKDVLATLFTVEEGLVSVLLRGVKKMGAKLKYAKELFTFAEFGVSSKGEGLYILTSCDVIESFSNLAQDPQKYLEAITILNAVKDISHYGEQNIGLFFALINSLQTLSFDNVEENLVLCKFLYEILNLSGYQLNFSKCADCGMVFAGKKLFAQRIGGFVCVACRAPDCIEVGESTFSNLRILSNIDFNKLKNLKLANLDDLLNFLINIIRERPGINIKLY
ncbi:MAG: DNA repair protein RecO [Clostridia bacterium]|nr:DNA repair protein RecO [Clostridia bacterium]